MPLKFKIVVLRCTSDLKLKLIIWVSYRSRPTTDTPRIGHVSHCHRPLWGGGALRRICKAAVIYFTRLTVAQDSNSIMAVAQDSNSIIDSA